MGRKERKKNTAGYERFQTLSIIWLTLSRHDMTSTTQKHEHTHTDILSPCKPKRASDIADEVSRVRSDSAILFAICFIRYRTSTVSGPGRRKRRGVQKKREMKRERKRILQIERDGERDGKREKQRERENEI